MLRKFWYRVNIILLIRPKIPPTPFGVFLKYKETFATLSFSHPAQPCYYLHECSQ